MPSNALKKFNKTVSRSISLLELYAAARRALSNRSPNEGQPPIELDDLVRSAIVLSIAAMDTYFTDVFAETLVPYLKKHCPSRHLVKILSDAGLDTAQALGLLSMKRPYRRIRTLIETHHTALVTQRFDAVDQLFQAYGLKDFSRHVQSSLGRRNLVRRIEILIARRHDIVHGGDLNRRGKLRPIQPTDIGKRIVDLMVFIGKADERIMSRI